MKNESKRRLQRIVSREIAIEYKACLYFSCIMFFYMCDLLWSGTDTVSVWAIWEIILTAYAVGYLQCYLFWNFDEAEQIGRKEFCAALLCTGLYAGVSWGFGWFGKNLTVTLLFIGYMLLCYLCVFWANKIKRAIDTRNLNKMLDAYKKGEEDGGKRGAQGWQ